MLKNKAWIVALLAALAIVVFFGCTDAGLYTPPETGEEGEWEFVELGPVGFKGGEPGSQQGWYSIGYTDSGLLGTPTATLEQFITASYLVVKFSTVPTSVSGETAAVQVIWGGDGNGWNSSSNVTVSTAPGSPIRYDADGQELWVELSGKTMSSIEDYRALKEGARLVLQCWNYSDAYESAKLAIASDGKPPVEPPPEVIDPTKYIVPKKGGTFFFLDLNDYATSGAVNPNVPIGFANPVQLTLLFTENDQRANFKLTEEQVEALVGRDKTGPVTVDIYAAALGALDGEASTTTFRFHLGNPKTGSDWNGTTGNGPATISTLAGTQQTLTFVADVEKTPAKLEYFILQQRAAASTEVVIRGIKISYKPSVEDLTVEAEDKEAFPENIAGGNGLEYTDGSGQKWYVMAPGSLDYDGDGGQQYSSEIRTKFSDFEPNWEVYSTFKLTVIARYLTTAELEAEGWTQTNPTGDMQMTDKPRVGEYSALGNGLTYPKWEASESGSEKVLEYDIYDDDFADQGEWSGFIFSHNSYQWNSDGNARAGIFLVRITKIEFEL